MHGTQIQQLLSFGGILLMFYFWCIFADSCIYNIILFCTYFTPNIYVLTTKKSPLTRVEIHSNEDTTY